MLVLTRKVGESIAIGDNIKVKVVELKGSQVRLGIQAPDEMRIYREEIYVRVQQENQRAASWELSDFRSVVDLLENSDKEQS